MEYGEWEKRMKAEVKFYDRVDDGLLKFAVIFKQCIRLHYRRGRKIGYLPRRIGNIHIADQKRMKAEVKFYDRVDDGLLKFAVIIAKSNGKWATGLFSLSHCAAPFQTSLYRHSTTSQRTLPRPYHP